MRFMGVEPHSKGLFARITLPLAVFGLINQAARTVWSVRIIDAFKVQLDAVALA